MNAGWIEENWSRDLSERHHPPSCWILLCSVVQRLLLGEEGDHLWTLLQRVGAIVSIHFPSSCAFLSLAPTDGFHQCSNECPMAYSTYLRCVMLLLTFLETLAFLEVNFLLVFLLPFQPILLGFSHCLLLLCPSLNAGVYHWPFSFFFPSALSGWSHPLPCPQMITNNQ